MNACKKLTNTRNTMRSLQFFRFVWFVAVSCGLNWILSQEIVAAPPESYREGPARIDFNRQIRPILSDHCFQCHGPDSARRQADLRLDDPRSAKLEKSGRAAIFRGDATKSELISRITAKDPAERMPPVETGRNLTPVQVELLNRWISEGADWPSHWAFQSPIRSLIPTIAMAGRTRHPIDHFVQSRLESHGIELAIESVPAALLRRISFDLTGLPPQISELDEFLADASEDAYERAVDRLLASPRFGERMAVRWLDGARYADTSGYQSDGERTMWRWRDWVIDAYNRDLPFDQFTIEQLAGDLLPNAKLDQRIATGFNRNHRGNSEGGIVPEEFAVEYVVDRVETTFTVWMGLTMGCTRCHDHKFDPLSQREFYEAFAYFNNVPEYGRALKFGNSPPYILAPTFDQQQQLASLEQQLTTAREAVSRQQAELSRAQSAWETRINPETIPDWVPENGQIWPTIRQPAERSNWIDLSRPEDGPIERVPGHRGSAVTLNGAQSLNAGDIANFGFFDKFTLSAWIYPRGTLSGTILSRTADVDRGDGYSLTLNEGKVQLNLVKRWLDDALRVETDAVIKSDQWHHVLAVYDGSRAASGITIYVDGVQTPIHAHVDLLYQNFATKAPLRIGGSDRHAKRFQGMIDDVRIFNTALASDACRMLSVTTPISKIVALPVAKRSEAEAIKLRAFFLANATPADVQRDLARVIELEQAISQFRESCPTTMVMAELPQPRPSHILIRGEYDKPGDRVEPRTPRVLPEISSDFPRNRLGLARWLVQPSHPLTARIAVNRAWQMLFGTGLVKTVDDFGAQGEPPSHPELLDWLAVEFSAPATHSGKSPVATEHGDDSNWHLKRLIRMLVTSATYRQSSHASPELLRIDPENRLLSRGPRRRLSAEMVRDQALFAAGLLVETLGGPSVKPYQPPGLWKELGDSDYQQDRGPGLYRRTMYTFWKRTVPPPTLLTFDAAGRETCIVRESRTNTPLQALILMNDVTYVEAARAMAAQVMQATTGTVEERLEAAFRLGTSRRPLSSERAILHDAWHAQRDRFQKDPSGAQRLLAQGESSQDNQLDACEWAAYTTICSLILNLDEVITKE